MNPRQDDVRGHLADDARIMPIACQPRIGFVAVGEQRGSMFHVGVYEGFDRGGGIVGNHREANATGTRVEDIWRACVAVWLDSYRLRERQFRPDQLRRRLPVVRDPDRPSSAGAFVSVAKRFCRSRQAGLAVATPPCRWNASSSDARPRVVSGNLERCITVPAVTAVARKFARAETVAASAR